ncbi:MAG: isoaspartyl peptidase/L-asparaginase family protein [Duodenibacillus sp.]
MKPLICIHGGAGNIRPESIGPEEAAQLHAGLRQAVQKGAELLAKGAQALEAVTCAVTELENNPLFNAGRGAVFTREGTHEMDACVMDGRTREAGAVCGLRSVKNPITAALCIMQRSPHVMMAGKGAEDFVFAHGVESAPQEYFNTEKRLRDLKAALAGDLIALSEDPARGVDHKYGTVGAVALDMHGNVAAATSTGGMTAKLPGRIGDSPVLGAGTWADNRACAISCTGHGEFFIRENVAATIASRMRFGGMSLEKAVTATLDDMAALGGRGGVIAVAPTGEFALLFNTPGMYRAVMRVGEAPVTAMFAEQTAR